MLAHTFPHSEKNSRISQIAERGGQVVLYENVSGFDFAMNNGWGERMQVREAGCGIT